MTGYYCFFNVPGVQYDRKTFDTSLEGKRRFQIFWHGVDETLVSKSTSDSLAQPQTLFFVINSA